MRNKYKNIINRELSLKGGSFIIPEIKSDIISDEERKYKNRNSFIKVENKGFGNKLFNKNKEKNAKKSNLNKGIITEKNKDKNCNLTSHNTIKTSNHNILISVYKKNSENNSNKKESTTNTNLNDKIISTRNSNTNLNLFNSSNKNYSSNNLNKVHNSNLNYSNRKFSQNSYQNINEINDVSNNKKEIIKSKDVYLDKNKIVGSENKNKVNNKNNNNKNKITIINCRRKKNYASYNNIINNTEINKENVINLLKDKAKLKTEIDTKKYNNGKKHNYNSASNICTVNNTDCNKLTSNDNKTKNEGNNQDKKLFINYWKEKIKNNNLNNDKSLNSNFNPTNNLNISTRGKRKMTYRSKRASNINNNDENEISEINHDNIKIDINNKKYNDNNNDDYIPKIKKRKYIIKVAKNPNEINNIIIKDNEVKTEDINIHKKKIRHFLYYKSNKEKEEKSEKIEKQDKDEKDEKEKDTHIFSPKIFKNYFLYKSEKNSPENSYKKVNNRVFKISPKPSIKILNQETNQNYSNHNSYSPIFQSCKNDINNKIEYSNNLSCQELNNSFTGFSKEIKLKNDKKITLFNLIDSSDNNNFNNSRNNITTSNINTYKNISCIRNKNHSLREYSPTNIIYRKKMNLIKSLSNYYKKYNGIVSPRIICDSESNPNLLKYNNMNIFAVKKDKNSKSSYEYSNNIINNNTYNTTLNIFKMNNLSSIDKINPNSDNINVKKSNKNRKPKNMNVGQQDEENENIYNKNKTHLRVNSELKQIKSSSLYNEFEENNKNDKSSNLIKDKQEIRNSNNNVKRVKNFNTFLNLSDIVNNISEKKNENNDYSKDINDSYKINLEILYILESKLQNIINKLNNYSICPNECFDLITYYFSSKFYQKEINVFRAKHSINNISYYIKLELLCYFLCYDVCFNKSFTQTGILLKTIFNLLHNNYLILISFILYDDTNNENNNEWLSKLKIILKNNLKTNLSPTDYNENNILTLIGNNLKEANTYYKMIIDNLYSNLYTKKNNKKNFDDIKYKFPNCLQLDINDLDYYEKLNVISLFFFDAYRLLDKYNFEDLKYFFDSFLQRIKFKKQKNSEKSNKIPRNKINSKGLNMKNIIIYKYNYSDGNFYYLPPIKKPYKYTLVLDLDETLVYFMPNNMFLNEEGRIGGDKHALIFRPGLIDFLKKMRPLFELVIFSFGTFDYVDNVIKIIEKKEKYFEYVLYRQHATVSNNEYIKDLSLLGRDLKNIIIVDDIPQVFKMQERNGICIKPFSGDIVSERNTLKILGKILEKVRFDAEEDGDIRKSLDRQRSLILSHITNINE